MASREYLSKEEYLADLKVELEAKRKIEPALEVEHLLVDSDEYFERSFRKGRSIATASDVLGTPRKLAEALLVQALMRPRFRRAYDMSRVKHLIIALRSLMRANLFVFLKTALLLAFFTLIALIGWSIILTTVMIGSIQEGRFLASIYDIPWTTAHLSVVAFYGGLTFTGIFLGVLGFWGSGRLFRLSWVCVRSSANGLTTLDREEGP